MKSKTSVRVKICTLAVLLFSARVVMAQPLSTEKEVPLEGIELDLPSNLTQEQERQLWDMIREGRHVELNVPVGGESSEGIDAAEDVVTLTVPATEVPKALDKQDTSFFKRVKSALGFKKKEVEQVSPRTMLPDDPEIVSQMQGFSDEEIGKFVSLHQKIMRKGEAFLKKSKMPIETTNEILTTLSKYLWSGAATIISSNASSTGLDIQLYAGAGTSSVFKELTKKIYVGYLLPQKNNLVFSGSGGVSVLRVSDGKGGKKTFVDVPVAAQRSSKIRTVSAGLGGYAVYLNQSWYKDVDPETGTPKAPSSKTETLVLGALGQITKGENYFSIALDVGVIFPPAHFVGLGGMSLVPFVGALAFYDTNGVRKSVLRVPSETLNPMGGVKAVMNAYQDTKNLFNSTKGTRTCSALLSGLGL